MINKTQKITLSLVAIGLLITGCGSNPAIPNQVATNSSNTITQKQFNSFSGAMDKATNKAPNVKVLESYVNKDIEEIYYFNLLKDYIHNPSNIKTKDNSKTISSSDMKSKFKDKLRQKFGGKLSEAQLESIVNKQFGNSSTKTIKQASLLTLPVGATSSNVELNDFDLSNPKGRMNAGKSGIINIIYDLDNEDTALNKLASLTAKISNFLSHDKDWAIDNAKIQTGLQNTISDTFQKEGMHDEFISDMNKRIKEAKANGQDTKYMEQGLAKYKKQMIGKKVPKSKNSAFVYSWYDSKEVRNTISIRLNVQDNKLIIEFATTTIR